MPRPSRLRVLPWFSVLCLTAAWQIATADDGASPSQEQGWRIFQGAREAAGAGPAGTALRDYSYELVTRTQTPGGDVELRSSGLFVAPTFVRQNIHGPSGEIVMVFDGSQAWQVAPAGRRELPAAMTSQFRSDLRRAHVLLASLQEKDSVWYLRQEEVHGRPVDVIEIREIGGTPLRLFIDVETKDLLKTMYVGDTPGGMAQVEEFYSDFTEVGGIRWPQRKRVLRNGKQTQETGRTILQVNSGLTKSDILP